MKLSGGLLFFLPSILPCQVHAFEVRYYKTYELHVDTRSFLWNIFIRNTYILSFCKHVRLKKNFVNKTKVYHTQVIHKSKNRMLKSHESSFLNL